MGNLIDSSKIMEPKFETGGDSSLICVSSNYITFFVPFLERLFDKEKCSKRVENYLERFSLIVYFVKS